MTLARSHPPQREKSSIRAAVTWGVVVGAIQAASPLGFWRLDPSWPPFCAAVDWVVALAIGIEIVAGINLQS